MAWQPTSRLARKRDQTVAVRPSWTCARGRKPHEGHVSQVSLFAAIHLAWAITALLVLAACSSGSHASRDTTRSADRAVQAWLLTRAALAEVTPNAGVRATLQHSRVLEILRPGQYPLPGSDAEAVVTFASAAALQQAIRAGELPAGTYGVLYDPEAWALTPAAEQRAPVQMVTRAGAVAHAHGLRLIVAPALNLTKVLTPASRAPRWRAFLALNLVRRVASVADVVELQAQSLERSTTTYAAFVRAAALQAKAGNGSVEVLAGLSTNPPGQPVASWELTDAIHATQSVVEGYWLNIPGQGTRCPSCNAARPDIAIQTLQAVR
jgi:hypothetical protein